MMRSVLEVLFPRRCVGCGGAGWPFCLACADQVASLMPPGCERCGRPLEVSTASCRDCPPPPISWTRSAFLYEGPVRRALMRLKFSGLQSVVDAFAESMAGALESWGREDARAVDRTARQGRIEAATGKSGEVPPARPLSPPEITWVPLGPRRKRARGYDQAEMLARATAACLGWPVRRVLARTLETTPQARRQRRERLSALRGAFTAVDPAAVGPFVLLVDDVLTSGSTAAECARVLRLVGAGEVGVLTAARSLGGTVRARCYTRSGLQPGSVVARETASGSRCQPQAKRPT